MTATLVAAAVVAVAMLVGPDLGHGVVAPDSVAGSSWLSTDPVGPIITEVVSSNASTLADEDGDQPDWIELHNPTHEPIELEGYHLSDDEDDPARWAFPAVVLEPDGHLVVFASGKDRRDPAGELHTDFRLAQGDEPVLLVQPDGGTVADQLPVVEIPRNASFGRQPGQLARTCYFAFPSPGSHNTDECFDDTDLGAPTLSRTTGFYDEPFDLEITAPDPDATIYYTLDGSFPDPDTNPDNTRTYDGPLRIVDRTPEPNTVSMIPTTVPERREFIAPGHDIPKGTAIRARTRHSATSVGNYFVGDVPPRGDLAVVALTIDPDYLFDHDIGIHVGGRLTEEWRQSEDHDAEAPWSSVEANYMWRGREWERPLEDQLHNAVTFDFCPSETRCDFQQDIGLRIHGGFSRHMPNKSLRLYARTDYGPDRFEYDFFGDGTTGHRRLILRNSGNDWARLRFADAFFQSLMGTFAADTQATRPAILYINGEYWGIHNIRERQDEYYLAALHGADPAQVDLLDNSTSALNEVRRADTPPEGFYRASPARPEVYEDWRAFVESVTARDPASGDFAEVVESQLEVDSFIDFIIGHAFAAANDWVGNNSRWWRHPPSLPSDDSEPLDGRWRFMIADLDSWGRGDGEYDSLTDRLAPGQGITAQNGIPALFNALMENPELQGRFVARFSDLLNTTFAEPSTLRELGAWRDRYRPDMSDHRVRWNTGGIADWHEAVDQLSEFLHERPAIQRQQLRDRFELGENRKVTVTFEPEVADIQLNSLRLSEWVSANQAERSESVWSGTYFQGQTLRLEASTVAETRFSHWLLNGDVPLPDKSVVIPIDGDIQVRLVLASTE